MLGGVGVQPNVGMGRYCAHNMFAMGMVFVFEISVFMLPRAMSMRCGLLPFYTAVYTLRIH